MSIKINIDSLDDDMREKIHNELKIVLENNKYNQFAPKKEIYPFNILNDDIYLPFYEGRCANRPKWER